MAIFHSSVGVISRGQGQSLAERAAYICGKKFFDEYCGQNRRYFRRDVTLCEVCLPADAPAQYADAQVLITEIDRSEKRCDAQTAREIIFALPVELSEAERIDLSRKWISKFWVSRGMCALFAIHDKGTGNPHVHVLLTTRNVDQNGFSTKKNRDWNRKELYLAWRKFLANAQNLEFSKKGLDVRVSNESYAVQGIDKKPTKYLGPRASALAKKGIFTERAEENLAILDERKRREQKQEAKKLQKRHRVYRRYY